MAVSDMPRDAQDQILYLARDVKDRTDRKLALNRNGSLQEDLRKIAEEHNVLSKDVHDQLLSFLRIEFDPEVLDQLLRAPLQFIAQ